MKIRDFIHHLALISQQSHPETRVQLQIQHPSGIIETNQITPNMIHHGQNNVTIKYLLINIHDKRYQKLPDAIHQALRTQPQAEP